MDLNLSKGRIWPLLFYMEMILIVMPLILVLYFGVPFFGQVYLYVVEEKVFVICLVVMYSLIVLALALGLMLRVFSVKPEIVVDRKSVLSIECLKFANASLLTGFLLLIFSCLFFSYKHAFFESIFFGERLLEIRLQNKYASALPSQLGYVGIVAYTIVSIYSGICLASNRYFKFLFYLMGSLILASASGDKAPLVMVIVYSLLSYCSQAGLSLSFKGVVKGLVVFLGLYCFLYFVVSRQIDDMDIIGFNIFLLERLGVGQMAGVFETLSIDRLSGDFFLHAIPFSRLLYDYVPYDKALMMFTEGYEFEAMGVKNSFFLSEAYGIGGWVLLLFSPIIVGASYAVGLYVFRRFMAFLYGGAVVSIYLLPFYIISMPLTGGFSSYPFFKGLILNVFAVALLFPAYKLLGVTSFRKNGGYLISRGR